MLRRVSFLRCLKKLDVEKHAALSGQRLQPFTGAAASASSMSTFRDQRQAPETETIADLRRRALYQSQYRGMVELDVILGSFAKNYLDTMEPKELKEYDTILKQFDNDLYNWLLHKGAGPPQEVTALATWAKLFDHVAKNRKDVIEYRV